MPPKSALKGDTKKAPKKIIIVNEPTGVYPANSGNNYNRTIGTQGTYDPAYPLYGHISPGYPDKYTSLMRKKLWELLQMLSYNPQSVTGPTARERELNAFENEEDVAEAKLYGRRGGGKGRRATRRSRHSVRKTNR